MATRRAGNQKPAAKPETTAPVEEPKAAVPERKVRVIKDKKPSAKPFIILSEKGLPQARFRTEEEVRANLKRFK